MKYEYFPVEVGDRVMIHVQDHALVEAAVPIIKKIQSKLKEMSALLSR